MAEKDESLLIDRRYILAEMKARTKDEALLEIATVLSQGECVGMRDDVHQALLERENLASTGIGDKVAIPHGRLAALDHVLIAVTRSSEGISFGAIDGIATHLFFALVSPAGPDGAPLKILAKMAGLCKRSGFRERLLAAGTSGEMYRVIMDPERGSEAQ